MVFGRVRTKELPEILASQEKMSHRVWPGPHISECTLDDVDEELYVGSTVKPSNSVTGECIGSRPDLRSCRKTRCPLCALGRRDLLARAMLLKHGGGAAGKTVSDAQTRERTGGNHLQRTRRAGAAARDMQHHLETTPTAQRAEQGVQ